MQEHISTESGNEFVSLDDRVRLKRQAVFYDHSTGNMFNFLIGALFLFLVLWQNNSPKTLLYSWITLVIVEAIITIGFERSVRKSDLLKIPQGEKWVKYRLKIGAINAFIYGITPLLLPKNVDPAAELYLFIILSTLVTVASVSYSTIPKFIYLISLISMGPLGIYFFTKGDQFHLIMGFTTLLWIIVVLKKAAEVSRTTINQIVDSERLQDEIRRHEIVKKQIKAMAHQDLLTGIANRRMMESIVNRSIHRAKRENEKLGLIIIDLDDFKPINDQHGHHVGDEMLKHVASNLSSNMRASDLVARIGGDEFCIILEEVVDKNDIYPMIQKLQQIISQPMKFGEQTFSVNASLGYAQLPDDGDTMDSLMRAADLRMYQSKRNRKLVPIEEF